MSTPIEAFFQMERPWQQGLLYLRQLAQNSGLEETLKWNHPCYTYQNKNIVTIGHFKNYFCLSFFKGALLDDTAKVLESAGENSASFRMFRFTATEQIKPLEKLITQYLFEAIEIEKAGLKVVKKPIESYTVPIELTERFFGDAPFKNAFYKLTPGRQKGYLLFFSSAKQSQTRVDRIEKYYSRILKGFGQNDCVCGHSKRLPGCDGSHKFLKQQPQL